MPCEIDQLFSDPRDSITDEDMMNEMFYSMLSRHPLHILDQSQGTDLYGDPSVEPVYSSTVEMPMLVKLDPPEQLLTKYGIDETRDALVLFSRKVCYDLSVVPKIGDRLDFTYRTAAGSIVNEHLILNTVAPWDFQRNTVDHYTYVAGASRTHKKYKPDTVGNPATPKLLPFDVKCLKGM